MAIENPKFGKGIALAGGFDLGAKAPLDSRYTVASIEERDAHVTGNRAYEGMLVYVEDNGVTYQYIKGADGSTLEWVEFGFNTDKLQAEIVNDLVTGGETKILSAEQGKVLKGLIGDLPESIVVGQDSEGNDIVRLTPDVIAYVNAKAEETLSSASGGSTESAASVLAALNSYKASNDAKVNQNTSDIADIKTNYATKEELTAEQTRAEGVETELRTDVDANAAEIERVNQVLLNAIENNAEGLDSIKELATWINEHGTEAEAMATAIGKLEAIVDGIGGDGEEATVVAYVAKEIATAITALNIDQYATADDLSALSAKVDTGDKTVSEYVAEAITGLAIGDYAKVADLNALAVRVTAIEEAGYQNADQVNSAIDTKITALDLANTYEAKGTAETLNSAMDTRVTTLESNYLSKKDASTIYETKVDADQKLTDAQAYTDNVFAQIQALTDEEILEIIANSSSSTEEESSTETTE